MEYTTTFSSLPGDFCLKFVYTYRRIAKTPRPLLYLEFEYNLRKIAKNILCYLVKLEYNSRKFDLEFNTTSELFSRFYGKLKTTFLYHKLLTDFCGIFEPSNALCDVSTFRYTF